MTSRRRGRGQQPDPQPDDLRAVRDHHARDRDPRQQARLQRGVRLLHRGRRLLRPAERHRDLRRLPLGRVVPRHRRRDRDQRLRRLPLLRRLPRRVAGGAAAGRRAPAEHRQVHDGRRAGVQDAPAPGPRRGRDVHPGRVVLLPARPDGRRGRPRRAAAQRHQQGRAGRRHRHRRRRDDRLRADRRHARHHLGADHQGGAAHRGRRDHDDLGARAARLQPLRGARRRRRAGRRHGREAARAGRAVRQERHHPPRLHLPRPGPRARHRGPAAHPHALLHGARRPRRPAARWSGRSP